MTRRWLIVLALLAGLELADSPPAPAQEARDAAYAEPAQIADTDAARRDLVLAVLSRSEVRRAAWATGLDMNAIEATVERLEGEPLARAARQAEQLDRRLAIDGVISSTTLIILLLLTILIIVAVQS
jgi:hypothetical protein